MSDVVGELEVLWQKGQLRELEDDLDRFIRAHLGEIRRSLREGSAGGLEIVRRRYSQGEISDHHLVDFCVRTFLRRKGSCNPRRDIQEQKGEIDKEVWYEGERRQGPVPPDLCDKIAMSWCREHAGNWRDWRIFQLLYVWNKLSHRYVQLIASGQDQ